MNLFKTEIRENIRPLRRLISPAYREKASLRAAKHFIESPYFQNNHNFACYMALAEEIDAFPIIQALWQAKKACYLPILAPEQKLRFVLYEQGLPLGLNAYQIQEPQNFTQELAASQLDVVLLPLLAFDLRGNRLGTGGGYYDRTFSFMLEPEFASKNKPHLLGLGYELQKISQLPREAFDVPMEGMITEETIYYF